MKKGGKKKIRADKPMSRKSPEFLALRLEAEWLATARRAVEAACLEYARRLTRIPNLAVVDAAILVNAVGLKLDIKIFEDVREQNAAESAGKVGP